MTIVTIYNSFFFLNLLLWLPALFSLCYQHAILGWFSLTCQTGFWSPTHYFPNIPLPPKCYTVCYTCGLISCFWFLLSLITACAGTWEVSWAFFYNKGISRQDSSNESTEVCLQCSREMFDLWRSFWAPITSEWDAWHHRWKWASSGLLNFLFLIYAFPFLYWSKLEYHHKWSVMVFFMISNAIAWTQLTKSVGLLLSLFTWLNRKSLAYPVLNLV